MTVFNNKNLAKKYTSYHDYDKGNLINCFSYLPKSSKVLDVGCGTGRSLSYLRQLGFKHPKGIERESAMFNDPNIYEGNFWALTKKFLSDFDTFLFLNSLHLIAIPPMLKESYTKIFNKINANHIVIETLTPHKIPNTSLNKLFPDIDPPHLPADIMFKILAPMYKLIHWERVEYGLPMKSELFAEMLRNRFVSPLAKVSEEKIQEAINNVMKSNTYIRREYMDFSVWGRR
jgi:hypothetical protein